MPTAWGAPVAIAASQRLNHVYTASNDTYGVMGFAYKVQTEFPWFVCTGTSVIISSSDSHRIP